MRNLRQLLKQLKNKTIQFWKVQALQRLPFTVFVLTQIQRHTLQSFTLEANALLEPKRKKKFVSCPGNYNIMDTFKLSGENFFGDDKMI